MVLILPYYRFVGLSWSTTRLFKLLAERMKKDKTKFQTIWAKIDGNNMVVAVVSCIFFGLFSLIRPSPLYVPPNDSNSAFPHAEKNALPSAVMGIVLGVVAIAVFVGAHFLKKFFPHHFHSFRMITVIWGLLACEGIANTCVAIFKNMVGRARPDLYALCGEGVTSDPSSCPNLSKMEFYDQFRSWPSGHSSTAMSGFLYIALFVQSFFVSDEMWTSAVASLFVLLAFYCGSTRIRDFKHHPDDVIAGFFTGFVFTYIIWNRIKKQIFVREFSQQSETTTSNDSMNNMEDIRAPINQSPQVSPTEEIPV